MSTMTAAAARTSATAQAWSASETGPKHWAAASSSTAHLEPARPWTSRSRSTTPSSLDWRPKPPASLVSTEPGRPDGVAPLQHHLAIRIKAAHDEPHDAFVIKDEPRP